MPAPANAAVRVPATSANLGPGFDCLGLALDIYLEVSCLRQREGLLIRANEPEIATDASNLVVRAMSAVFEARLEPVPGLAVTIANAIPLARGLGSSAAAITAGLMLANALLDTPFSKRELLDVGLPLEGHADNLAPALFGGLCVSSVTGHEVTVLRVQTAKAPRVALFIPDRPMSTTEARKVLPASVPREDAVFNTGRSSLLVAALANGDFSALRAAMEDRLHQPYRTAIFPEMPKLIQAAINAGAAGAALSGAGSSIIALCEDDPRPVIAAMERVGVAGRGVTARLDTEGATLTA